MQPFMKLLERTGWARLQTAAAVVCFIALFIGLEVGSFTRKSATWDEPIHLTSGYLALAAGDYRVDPSHPPLLRMWAALPLLFMHVAKPDTSEIDRTSDNDWLQDAYAYASRFMYHGQDADRLLYAARFMVVLWGVGLGLLLFFWARQWLGFGPAAVALGLYTIEPNIAAHAQLVTTDLGAAFFFFATVYCLWRACRRPTIGNLTGLTISFALAFLVKFSAVLLIPIVCLLLIIAVALRMRLSIRAAAGIVLLLAGSTFLAVWAAYGFRYLPSASPGWSLQLEDMPMVMENVPTLGRVAAWVDARHILPNAFTEGFLFSQATGRQMAYLAGQYSDEGWWYYFPVAFLVKTPSVVIMLLLAGVVLLVVQRRQFGIANELFVVVPVVVYMAFAMASGINIGLRHILPIYPFVLLIAAAAAKQLIAWRRPLGQYALAALLAFRCVMFINVYPNVLTAFNVFAGGPANGLTYLADSNLDWGQDLKPLKTWMQRKNVDHINLAYFGTADPNYYGIMSTYLPGTLFFGDPMKPMLPGYVAISSTLLSGVYLRPRWRLFYSGFLNLTPVDVIGNSIRVYWIERWPEPQSRRTGGTDPAETAQIAARLANDLLFQLDWPDPAVRYYRAALENTPDDVMIMGNLGVALMESGHTSDAISLLERAASLAPGNGDVRYRFAGALLKEGRADEALAEAQAAVRISPNNAVARNMLGITLEANGKLDAAEAAFQKALALAPDFEDARERLRKLRTAPPRPQ